jgi:hypothetical protein
MALNILNIIKTLIFLLENLYKIKLNITKKIIQVMNYEIRLIVMNKVMSLK